MAEAKGIAGASAFCLLLLVNVPCTGKAESGPALPWCSDEEAAESRVGPPPTTSLPSAPPPLDSSRPDLFLNGNEINSASKFDRFLKSVEQDPAAKLILPDGARLSSLSFAEKANLADDVGTVTNIDSITASTQPSSGELHSGALLLKERDWLAKQGGRMDPRVVSGILGGPPNSLSGFELSQKDRELGDLAATYLRGERVNIPASGAESNPSLDELLGMVSHQPEVSQVDPGDNTDPGALGNVGPGTPVVVDKAKQCLRKAKPTDWRPNPATNSLPIAFDPAGFPEVGMILRKIVAEDGTTTFGICTFTMIRNNYAVTAAHCAYQPVARGVQKIAALVDPAQTLALLPQPTKDAPDPTTCFSMASSRGKCRYLVAAIAEVYAPDNLQWPTTGPTAAPVPEPDIALLRIAFSGGATVPFAHLAIELPADRRITLAGFGVTTDTRVAKRGSFLVGWQDINQISKNGMKWVPSLSGRRSNPCPGDSGGPILSGDQFGVPHEDHHLIGIISRVNLKWAGQDPSQACLDQPGFGVVLAGFQSWISAVVAANRESNPAGRREELAPRVAAAN